MTDTTLSSEVPEPVYPRRKRPSSRSCADPPRLACGIDENSIANTIEEIPVKAHLASNVGSKIFPRKFCSPRSASGWYGRLKREILKSLRTKIFPEISNG